MKSNIENVMSIDLELTLVSALLTLLTTRHAIMPNTIPGLTVFTKRLLTVMRLELLRSWSCITVTNLLVKTGCDILSRLKSYPAVKGFNGLHIAIIACYPLVTQSPLDGQWERGERVCVNEYHLSWDSNPCPLM